MPKNFKFKFTTRDSMIVEIEAENEQDARAELQRRLNKNLIEFYQMETEDSYWRLLADETDTSDGKKAYDVNITVEVSGTLTVMAKSAEEAASIVEQQYTEGGFDYLALTDYAYEPTFIHAAATDDSGEEYELCL